MYDAAGRVQKEIGAKGYALAGTDMERLGTRYAYNKAGWFLGKREPVQVTSDGAAVYRLTRFCYEDCGNRTEERRYLDK